MRRYMPFLDMSLAIGAILEICKLKNCHLVKFSIAGGNDDSSLCWTQINQNINFCMNFKVKVIYANILSGYIYIYTITTDLNRRQL